MQLTQTAALATCWRVSAPQPAAPRFTVLDGMRGLAALVVITDHVPSRLLESLLPGRYLAVDYFFALSGFVLAHVYGARLMTSMSWFRFMTARVIRLFPLYILAVLMAAALALIASMKGWAGAAPIGHVIASTLFGVVLLPCPPALSIWPNAPFPLDGPAWSLFFELVANLGFALFIRRLNFRSLAVIMAVNAMMIAITAFASGKLDAGFAWSNFGGGLFRVGYSFFAGVFIYRLRAHWTAPALPVWGAFALLVAVFAVPAQGVWRPAFDIVAATLIFPALVATAANARVDGAARSLCVFMGTLSYGFYVLQVPVRDWLALAIAHFGGPNAPLRGAVDVLMVTAVTITVAWILNYVYDVPLRDRLSRKKQTPASVATASSVDR